MADNVGGEVASFCENGDFGPISAFGVSDISELWLNLFDVGGIDMAIGTWLCVVDMVRHSPGVSWLVLGVAIELLVVLDVDMDWP